MPEICPHPAKAHHPTDANNQPIPFATYEMDILGPSPKAMGQRKYLFVAVDYFTKKVEAEASASIVVAEVRIFFWKNIITHFGVPWVMIFDNG